ncbi:MAG: hypothetical protein IAE79_17285 [Anaerolinea sp.]|nr:hypothetical protein [Anaerolinea sp.]
MVHDRVAVLRHFLEIHILRVGDESAPRLHTLDPDILHYLERSQRLLITGNRASMPGHVANHLANGGHHWGIFRVRPDAPIRKLLQND